MAQFVGGANAKPQQPHFPRNPQPDVNIHPDSRLARPQQPEAWKGPHPFLQGHGFNGDIQSFNRRVQMAHDGYANAYKQEPSPGLLWDVAIAPSVEDGQIKDLFNVPLTQRDTKAQQWHLEAQHNGDAVHVREDGKVQPTNLLTAFRAKLGFNHPDLQPTNPKAHVLSVHDFHKKYPMIMDGFTGMIPFGGSFWKDVGESQGNPARFKQQVGFLTPKQAIDVANQAQDNQIAQSMQVTNQTIDPTAMFNPNNPQGSQEAYQAAVGKQAKVSIGRAFTQEHTQAISRNKQRQEWLLKHDPSGLFAGLQANGVFDRQWMVKYDQWSRTPGAAYLAYQAIAKQNYFDPTPSGIKDMVRAQKIKDKLANEASKWSEKFQIEATPLRFFSHGYFSLDHPLINNDFTPNTKEIHSLLTDFWKYEDTGTSSVWPIAALQGGFRFAKLGFDTMSGGFNQITADANGFTTLAGKGIPAILEGKSTKQIADMFATAVKQNPDWVRVLGFGYLPEHLTGSAAFLDGAGNFLLSSAIAMMARGPGYWKIGEDVPLEKLQGNLAVRLLTRLAHSNIKAGDLWRAEQVLGPGDSEKFITAIEKDIQSGKLDHNAFHDLATRYVHDGSVEYNGKTFDQGILRQLHSDKIPKSLTKITLQQLGPEIRRGLNNFELQALAHGAIGSKTEAFVRTLRNLFGLANPEGKSLDMFHQTDFPGRLEAFITNKNLMPRDQAVQVVNKFIRARARENPDQMQKILKTVNQLYRDKYPNLNFGTQPEFERLLETENLTHFRFASRPAPNFKDNPGLAFIQAINTAGSYWRTQILATGPGLFFKHLARDTAAALFGGMKIRDTAEMRAAWDAAQQAMHDHPELARQYGVVRKNIAKAEQSYMLRTDGLAENSKDTWNLQEVIHAQPELRQEFADRAAQHMRRQLTSTIYPAFQESLRSGDMGPMVDVILRDRQFRHLLNKERGIAKKLSQLRNDFPAEGESEVALHENVALRNMLKRKLVHDEATEYAKIVFQRYKAVLDEGKSHQLANVFDDVEKMIVAKPGTSDKDIAKYLLEHDLNIRVSGGTPVRMNRWDRTSGALIRAYMSPNRANRARMFESVFKQNYSNMLKMGYDPRAAMSQAVRLSEEQTKYHMLDFGNMLEFEQRFRGFLPFFTKHRLFTKWLVARLAQYPYMTVPISQVAKHLDSYGRLNFTLHGVPLNLSLSRLFWLNSQDLPVTIPGAEFVPYLNRTGLTPEITRFDSLIGAWIHGVGSGWNYKAVTAHMNPYDVRRLDKYMAVYAINYRMHHGEAAPVSESEALKYAMIRGGFFGGMTRDLIVNGAYLSPVTFSTPQTPGPIKSLDDQFSKLMNENPAKARAFLDKHPEAGLGWGMTQNFDVYNHVTQYWGLYDRIHSKYLKVEQRFSQHVLEGKPMTAEDYAKVRKAQQEYDQGIQHLLVQDARNWTQDAGGYKAGVVDQSGLISNYGPWGTLFLHDPISSINKLVAQFGGRKAFSSADLHKIYGYDLQGLQYAIDHYKELGLDSQARGDMIQKLNRIEGVYKVSGTPTLYSAYSQARNKFESKLIGLYDKAKGESGYAKAVTEYQARQLILDNYANPSIKYGGKDVKVLPFSEFGLVTKTPQELSLDIWKNMVGFSYSSLTYDQKQLLGIKTTPQVDEGWGVYNSWVADYQQQYGKEASSSVREQLAVAANRSYPGFYRDWKIAHLPKAFVLLYYAKGAFQGQYGNLWKQLADRAAQAYDTNRRGWANEAAGLDQWIRQNWPKGFVNEYNAAGGAQFLQGLTSPWG